MGAKGSTSAEAESITDLVIEFDASDPFPLLAEDAHTYREAQHHAALVDAWLGLETEKIEAALAAKSGKVSKDVRQLWIGLPIQALNTPYTELRFLVERLGLRSGETIVDLGAGYGRLGFVVAKHVPGARFVGYEFVHERVVESRRALERFGAANAVMKEVDLAAPEFKPEPADVYFLYDYGNRAAIRKTLADLKEIALARPIRVVGRGRASRDAIERDEPWLSQVHPPDHFDHFSIYRSADSVPALPID